MGLTKETVLSVVSYFVAEHPEINAKWLAENEALYGGEDNPLAQASERVKLLVDKTEGWLLRNTGTLSRDSARSVIGTVRHKFGENPTASGYQLLEAMVQVNQVSKREGRPEDYSEKSMRDAIVRLYEQSEEAEFRKQWETYQYQNAALGTGDSKKPDEVIREAYRIWLHMRERARSCRRLWARRPGRSRWRP